MKCKRSSYFIPFKKDHKDNINGPIIDMYKGGFVHEEASGIYTWLNLGIRSLEKLIKIIDEEHEKIGAIKILAPMLQNAELWEISGRLQNYGPEMLKIYDRNDRKFIFGPTAEELFANLLSKFSYNKDTFPLNLYNIQWKFRDEIRPRYGIIRGREFLMKDAYTFHQNQDCLLNTYKQMFQLYSDIFYRIGLQPVTLNADVGVMGGNLSHEFLIESEYGETYLDFHKKVSNKIKWDERDYAFEASDGKSYSEIGHIYALGDRYKMFGLKNAQGNPLLMGCYGIGISRIIGLLFEKKDLGIVAPFERTLVLLSKETECIDLANKIYEKFDDIIFDDRLNISYGEKFAEADLIKSPIKIFVGDKELKENKILVKQNGVEQKININTFF